VVEALIGLRYEPILVGGMALVLMGSQRVTRDFDFVIPHPGERLQDLVDVLAENATATKVSSFVLRVASEADLLRLKQIALSRRAAPGDAQDIAFLEGRRKRR
jgi:hypothetical protein